jgi:hypothetical protein
MATQPCQRCNDRPSIKSGPGACPASQPSAKRHGGTAYQAGCGDEDRKKEFQCQTSVSLNLCRPSRFPLTIPALSPKASALPGVARNRRYI